MLNQQTFHTILTTPAKEPPSHIPQSLEQQYDQFLCARCFSPSLKGYPYIKHALYFEQKNRHSLPSLTKDIYEEISLLYHTQPSAVERCITFSVKRAYEKNPHGFADLFPDCNKAPSNFRFIKRVSLHLLLP